MAYPAALRRAFPARSQAAMGLVIVVAAFLVAYLPLRDLVVVVGALAGAILLIKAPWIIWPILGGVLPFAAAQRIGPISALDVILAAAVALWFADGVRRRSLQIAPSAMVIPAMLYLATLALSSLGAADLDEAMREVIKWSQLLLVLLVAPAMLSPVQARWVVAALLAAATAQALLGLYQFVFRIGPEWFVLFDRFMRASGTFAQPNPYAGYLGLTLPVAVSLALAAWSALSARPERAGEVAAVGLLALIAAALVAAGMLASWSRGAWMGAVAAMAVVVFGRSRRAMAVGLALGGVGAVLVLLGALAPEMLPDALAVRLLDLPSYVGLGNVLQQPLTDENFAVVERVAHWVAALRMWEQALWLGVGPGNYAVAYESVRLPLWEEPLGHAHNIYLNTLAEGGLIGLGALLLLWGTVAWWTVKTLRTRPGVNEAADGSSGIAWRAGVGFGLLGVLAHLAVHSLFDSLFVQGMVVHLAMWIAVLAALSRASEDASASEIGSEKASVMNSIRAETRNPWAR